MANKFITNISRKINIFKPILIVIFFAMILVYSTLLARVTIVAALIPEEGETTAQASAGFLNALIFIIVAVAGGFLIALLFKYHKKLTLKFLFGGALFLAGTFIAFFFGRTILYLVQIKSFRLLLMTHYPIPIFENYMFIEPPIYQEWFYYLSIALFGFIGFFIAYVITSRNYLLRSKNIAVLCEGAFMGAFLAVILPTWTVLFLLIGLSLYDIYSVRKGPIRDIVEQTMREEDEYERLLFEEREQTRMAQPENMELPEMNRIEFPAPLQQIQKERVPLIKKLMNKGDNVYDSEVDDTDFMLSSMTYGTEEWDLGIGDLVFYSMLAAHPLSPYFVFFYGQEVLDKFGLFAILGISLFTVIGVLIGFIITLRLLRTKSMLPGLPISIGLGITGFIVSYGVMLLLA